MCGRTLSASVLAASPELVDVGRARAAGRRAEGDADPDLAEAAVEDVGAVAGRVHPGVDDPGGRHGAPGRPGDVLAQRPRAGALEVVGALDALGHRGAGGGDVAEEAPDDHLARVLGRRV